MASASVRAAQAELRARMRALGLGLLVEDGDLAAWVRGTESLCEYYAGSPAKALEHARDGQRYARASRWSTIPAVAGLADLSRTRTTGARA